MRDWAGLCGWGWVCVCVGGRGGGGCLPFSHVWPRQRDVGANFGGWWSWCALFPCPSRKSPTATTASLPNPKDSPHALPPVCAAIFWGDPGRVSARSSAAARITQHAARSKAQRRVQRGASVAVRPRPPAARRPASTCTLRTVGPPCPGLPLAQCRGQGLEGCRCGVREGGWRSGEGEVLTAKWSRAPGAGVERGRGTSTLRSTRTSRGCARSGNPRPHHARGD